MTASRLRERLRGGAESLPFLLVPGEELVDALGGVAGQPAKVQLRLPTAMPRSARSAALLVRQMVPSSRKRVKAGQRFNM